MTLSRLLLAAVGLALACVSLVGVAERASQGRQAILKWRPAFEALERGESPYRAPDGPVPADGAGEGYPTPPVSALGMAALLELGAVAGSLAFALLKLACAALLLVGSARLARAVWPFPPWAEWALLLLSLRVVLSDLSHGNINLLVGACVVAAALAWRAGRDGACGAAVAAGAALKVTPLLFAAFLAERRSARGLAGLALGLVALLLVAPSLALGWRWNLELLGDWWAQMVAPYLAGAPPGPMQAQHINQSLLGVLARFFTEASAIEARGDVHPDDVRVTLVALSPDAFSLAHRALGLGLLAVGALSWWRRPERRFALAHFAVGALLMLLLSERTWKHHHVVLALPFAWLLGAAVGAERARDRAVAVAALAAAALLFGATGSGVLGARGSDLAEALGAFFWGDLILLGAVAWTVRGAPNNGA